MTRWVLFAGTFALALTTGAANASDANRACTRLKDDLVKMLQGEKAHGKTYATAKLAPGGRAAFQVASGSPKWQWVIRSSPINNALGLEAIANPAPRAPKAPSASAVYTACEFFASADVKDWKHVKSPSQILTGDASRFSLGEKTANAALAGESKVTDAVLPTRIVVIQIHAVDEMPSPLVSIVLKARPKTKATASR